MTDPSNLMSIGRFSSLSRISVRMLRHYDAGGVLIPAIVDNSTG
ncbi:DNA-binding transcriptional MerR regulator [Nocardia sp. GAS34]